VKQRGLSGIIEPQEEDFCVFVVQSFILKKEERKQFVRQRFLKAKLLPVSSALFARQLHVAAPPACDSSMLGLILCGSESNIRKKRFL
jgi:hypothetical protein